MTDPTTPTGGTDPEEVSEIVRADLITVIEIVAVSFGPWQPEANGGVQRRSATFDIRLLEVLKGEVTAEPGDVVRLDTVQRGTGGARVMDYYGLWSHVPTDPGTRLVAFSEGATDPAAALSEGPCFRLVPAEDAIDDVRAAVELAEQRLPTARFLDEAARLSRTRGGVFARYVWARARDAVGSSADAFERFLAIAEDPGTAPEARESYLTGVYEDATLTDDYTPAQEARLARAMFRVALDPTAGELRDQLRAVYLPGLLGHGAAPARDPEEVFSPEPGLRADVEADARAHPEDYQQELRTWLQGEGG